VYFRKGDYEKALFYLQKAASLNPKEGVIWDHIGEVYKKMGENSKAIEYFQKALDNDLEPKDRKKLEEKMKEMIK
jgi:tetratricopeptide (TPR) repeat protein